MKIIDAHQHFWKYDAIKHAWINDEMLVLKKDFLPDDFVLMYNQNNVKGSIAVQADQSEEETMFLLDLAEQYSWIKGVVGWVDLSSSNIEERLTHFAKFEKLKGFRHILQDEPDPNYILKEDFQQGIACLGKYDYTYDILIYPHQMPGALETIKRFPEQYFVIDHIAKPNIKEQSWKEWASSIQVMATHERVYCKVSGMVTEADWKNWKYEDFVPYLDVIFEAFGTERVMFGSDYPVSLLAASFEQVKEIISRYIVDLSHESQQKIWRDNAIKFYKL